MTSKALEELRLGIAEVEALQRASPLVRDGLKNPEAARAVGRSSLVLLSSHLERFVYALFEAASDTVCNSDVDVDRLPKMLKLQYSRSIVEDLSLANWDKRESKLAAYSAKEAWLWVHAERVRTLEVERLLIWMKAPNPRSIQRAFRLWGIDDIFADITKTPQNKGKLILGLMELVEKRNNIAHGDFTMEATHSDVRRYISVVKTFGERCDKRMAAKIMKLTAADSRPW